MYVCMYVGRYPNQNTTGVKKFVAKNLKKAMLKRCDIKMGGQGLLLPTELKFLIIMTRPQNITVAYWLLMKLQFLIMMTRPQNITVACQ